MGRKRVNHVLDANCRKCGGTFSVGFHGGKKADRIKVINEVVKEEMK